MEQNDEKHSLTRQDIEQHLQSALAAATPNVWSKLDLSVPQDMGDIKEPLPFWRMERRMRHWGMAAACICLIAAGGVYHYEYLQVASIVGIDVNPSLRLSLNRREKVLKAEALNHDGAKVLDEELKGKNLESAVDQVVDSLVEEGYLKEGQQEQAVLVSVSGKSEKKAEKVKTAVTANMEDAISRNQVRAIVYDQTIQVTKELEELAEAYQVSVGKAGFIEQLVQENEVLSEDVQAAYGWMMGQSMEAITQEISEKEYSVSPRINVIQVEPSEEKTSLFKTEESEVNRKEPLESDNVKSEESKPGSQDLGSSSSGVEDERVQETEGKEADRENENTGDRKIGESNENPVAKEESKPADTLRNQREESSEDAGRLQETPESKETKTEMDKETAGETPVAFPETKEQFGEATSSTVEAIAPEQEEEDGQDKSEEIEEEESPEEARENLEVSKDNLEDIKENPEKSGKEQKQAEDREELEEIKEPEKDLEEYGTDSMEHPRQAETVSGNRQEHFVEYGQLVKDKLWLADNLQDNEPFHLAEDKGTEEKEIKDKETEEKKIEDKETEEKKIEDKETEAKEIEDKETEAKEIEDKETEEKRTEDKEAKETKAKDKEYTEKNDFEKNTDEENYPKEGNNLSSQEEEIKAHDSSENDEKDDAVELLDREKMTDKVEMEEKMAEGAPKDEEDSQEDAPEERDSKSANQIIRVKVEEKEQKEEEEPVYASQLLGFSQRRFLRRGPGAFEFIIADPKKNKRNEDDPEDEWEDDAEEELFSDTSDMNDSGVAEEEWDADMGEWLHIGPGYSSN